MRISDWSSDVCSSDLVWLAIADRKTRLMKTRIYLSLKAFMKDGDGAMLVDRLRVLAGNYRINRRGINAVRRSRYIYAGVYYNYWRCGEYKIGRASGRERVCQYV